MNEKKIARLAEGRKKAMLVHELANEIETLMGKEKWKDLSPRAFMYVLLSHAMNVGAEGKIASEEIESELLSFSKNYKEGLWGFSYE